MSLADRAKALELTDLAQTCYDAGRTADALSHAEAALRCDPDSLHARLLQARIHVAQQRPLDAKRSLDALVASHPQAAHRPDITLLRAEALALGGQAELAIKHLLALARRFPDDVRPHRLLATIHLQRNDVAQASNALHQVLRLEPSNLSAKRLLASLTAATHPQRAAEGVAKLPPHAWDDAAALAAAHWFIRAGRDADARALLEDLCRRHRHDTAVLIAAGELMDRIGDHAGAIRLLIEPAKQRGAHQPRALVALAKACMHAGRFIRAIRAWFTLTRLSPRDARAWSAIAVCAARLSRPTLMQRALHRCHRAEEALHATQPTRFVAVSWLRTTPACIANDLRSTQNETAPNDSPLTALLRRSLDTFETTSRQHPQWADTHYHAAMCHAALGHRRPAQEEVQAALDINPNYRAAVTLAGRLSHLNVAA